MTAKLLSQAEIEGCADYICAAMLEGIDQEHGLLKIVGTAFKPLGNVACAMIADELTRRLQGWNEASAVVNQIGS